MILLSFEKIKMYYDNKFWSKEMVGDAVKMKKITAEEYQKIVGEEYHEALTLN